MFATDFACHCPPRAVATPRAFSAAAMSLRDVAPAFWASRMMGRTFAANLAEADALWASRKAAHRRYFQAEERWKAAETSLRENLVTTSRWQLLKAAFETSNDAYTAIESEIELKSVELRKLNRIRRVCRDVRKRAATESAIQTLGQVIPFDADAAKTLDKSAADEAAATARIAALSEQITTLEAERTALIFDNGLLARADDIAQLRDRRIQVRAGKADLPKRRAELAVAEATFGRLAAELEWHDDIEQVIARIPAKAEVALLRGLLNRRGVQSSAVENAKGAVAESEEKLSEIDADIKALGSLTDVSNITIAIKAVRELGDLAGQIANSRRDEQEARTGVGRALKTLRPAVADSGEFSNLCPFRRWHRLRRTATPAATSNSGSRPAVSASVMQIMNAHGIRKPMSASSQTNTSSRQMSLSVCETAATQAGRSFGAVMSMVSAFRKTKSRTSVSPAQLPKNSRSRFAPRTWLRIVASSTLAPPRSSRSLAGRLASKTICWSPWVWKKKR